jgi:hypothetical protein
MLPSEVSSEILGRETSSESLPQINPHQAIALNDKITRMKAELSASRLKDVQNAKQYLETAESMLKSIA